MNKWLLLFLLGISIPASAFNEFYIPPPTGLDVLMNVQVTIIWVCDDCGSKKVNLSLNQDREDGTWAHEFLLLNVVNPGNYTWTPHTLEKLPKANGFHFDVYYEEKVGFNSGAVFIRDHLSSSSVSSFVASSTSLIPTPTSNSATSMALTSSATSTVSTSIAVPTNSSPARANGSIKVGLGVGLGIGVLFLLLLGGVLGYVFFRMRSKLQDNTTHERTDNTDWFLGQYWLRTPIQELNAEQMRHELEEERQRIELPGKQVYGGR